MEKNTTTTTINIVLVHCHREENFTFSVEHEKIDLESRCKNPMTLDISCLVVLLVVVGVVAVQQKLLGPPTYNSNSLKSVHVFITLYIFTTR